MTGARNGGSTLPEELLDEVDHAVLSRIRGMYDAADPVPADLYTRVRFAFDLASADYELASLSEPVGSGAAVRGSGHADTLTFESSGLTICVTIERLAGAAVRLDGWLDPAASLRVELATGDMRMHGMSDDGGRFAFDGLDTGEVRVSVYPTPGSRVELARTVVTPPFAI